MRLTADGSGSVSDSRGQPLAVVYPPMPSPRSDQELQLQVAAKAGEA